VDESKITSSFSSISRVSGLFIGFLYFAGFLTFTLYLARFGVSEFNLLRPHIFWAGALFALLCAVPIYSVLNLFGHVGPSRPKAPGGGRPIEHLTLHWVQTAAEFSVWFRFAACQWRLLGINAEVRALPSTYAGSA
jgi:hypothetical protein